MKEEIYDKYGIFRITIDGEVIYDKEKRERIENEKEKKLYKEGI